MTNCYDDDYRGNPEPQELKPTAEPAEYEPDDELRLANGEQWRTYGSQAQTVNLPRAEVGISFSSIPTYQESFGHTRYLHEQGKIYAIYTKNADGTCPCNCHDQGARSCEKCVPCYYPSKPTR